MTSNLLYRIPSKYKNYRVEKIKREASKRLFFRLSNDFHSVICMDSSKEKKEYKDFLNVHSYLSKINISLPIIYEKNDNHNILILEDFGNLRFDKILSDYSLKDLLDSAVKTLVVLNTETNFDPSLGLSIYNFDTFKSEISEFFQYYYPYLHKKNISINLMEEFFECWEKYFNSINFNFNNFIHKDFNINNLIYLPSRNDHLKCGVIDFQSAFWGENCWDLFSLLEDSRIYFDDQFNEYFINYFYENSNQKNTIDEFKEKYYMLNCSRQTRLLGRWVKLSQEFNQHWYLNFIDITKKRLFKGIVNSNKKNLRLLYAKLIPEFL